MVLSLSFTEFYAGMPSVGNLMKTLLNTARLRNNLINGFKQSLEFVMATKIFCQHLRAINQYAGGIASPIEMLIL